MTPSRLHRRTITKTLGALLILGVVAWVATPASLQAHPQDWCVAFCAEFCRDKGGCDSAVANGNHCVFSCNGC